MHLNEKTEPVFGYIFISTTELMNIFERSQDLKSACMWSPHFSYSSRSCSSLHSSPVLFIHHDCSLTKQIDVLFQEYMSAPDQREDLPWNDVYDAHQEQARKSTIQETSESVREASDLGIILYSTLVL